MVDCQNIMHSYLVLLMWIIHLLVQITIHPSLGGINRDCRFDQRLLVLYLYLQYWVQKYMKWSFENQQNMSVQWTCVPVSLSLVSLNSNLQNSTELTKNSFKWTRLALHIPNLVVFS